MLPLIKEPNPILRIKSKEIAKINSQIKQLVLDMAKAMNEHKGVGIAAPQVGQNIRLCLIRTEKGPLALINPKITWKSLRKEIEEEGCLSCPGFYGLVKRAKIIYVKALDQEGKQINFRAESYFARVIQHEVDHLNGVLIIDKFINKKGSKLTM
jgi:peptide deformylase